jgi:DNA polymerase III epsilon subunit-like protein
MNTFLVFDTETTGLFNTKHKPEEGIYRARDPLLHPEDYPRVFQLAFLLMSEDGEIIEKFSSYIKPDGWVIPTGPGNEFWETHGYSTKECEEDGVPMVEALEKFVDAMGRADYLVAHNLDFDKPVILSELSNYQVPMPEGFTVPKSLCTMKFTIDYVRADHSKENIEKYPFLRNANKFPKLIELHIKLFGEGFDGAHDALVDVEATFRCLKELKVLNILTY